MSFFGAPPTAKVAEDGAPVQGCCLTMCPPEEVRRRQKHKLVHLLECRPPSQDPRMPPSGRHQPLLGSSELFVKEFSRSAAGQENASSTVRPLPVLSRTVRYLLADALERRDVSAAHTHDFVADRLRAVVKDITLQDLLRNTRTATVLAACVRYHALHHYRMCSSREPSFDAFTHRQLMEGVLLSLVRHYHDQDKAGHHQEKPQYSFDLDDDEDNFFGPGREPDSSSSDEGEDTVVNQSDNTDVCGVAEKMVGLNLHSTDEGSKASGNSTINTQTLAKEEETSSPGSENDRKSHSESIVEGNPINTTSSSDTSHTSQSNRWTNISATQIGSLEDDNLPEERSAIEPQLTSTLNNIDITTEIENVDNCNHTHTVLQCSNEREEMECAYLLLFFNSSEALQHGLELHESLRKEPLLSSVLAALVSLQSTGNFVPVVRLMRSLPPILACCLLVNFKQLQLKALQVLTMGHSSRNTRYPLGKLVALLEFTDETEAKRMCQLCQLKIIGENQDFVSFQKDDFKLPDAAMDGPSRRDWLESKLSAPNIRSLLMPYPLPLH